MNFSDWTEEDVKKHNERIRRASNSSRKVPKIELYTRRYIVVYLRGERTKKEQISQRKDNV